MNFSEYITTIQKAYQENDKDLLDTTESSYGKEVLTYSQAEQVIAEQTDGLLKYMAIYKGISLSQFELLISEISKYKILPEETINAIKNTNAQMIKDADNKFKGMMSSGK